MFPLTSYTIVEASEDEGSSISGIGFTSSLNFGFCELFVDVVEDVSSNVDRDPFSSISPSPVMYDFREKLILSVLFRKNCVPPTTKSIAFFRVSPNAFSALFASFAVCVRWYP